jgi:hypothetical protein
MTIPVLMQCCVGLIKDGNVILVLAAVPQWHEIYNKKHWKCGTYRRSLILHSGEVIVFIIQRFYCPETKLTYSLLPFFITRYERHINSVIETFLRDHLINERSPAELADELNDASAPSDWTIKRWAKRFCEGLEQYAKLLERYLTYLVPQFRVAASGDCPLAVRVEKFLDNAKFLCDNSLQLLLNSALSYVNRAVAIQIHQERLLGLV